MLSEERTARLEQRKMDRKKKRMAEAVAMKKAEEERQGMFGVGVVNHYWLALCV